MSHPPPLPTARVDTPAERWHARHGLCLAAIFVFALAYLVPFLGYLTDDTFIYLQFARNLLAGHGFSFNAGDPTYGATSPLWVFLIAGVGSNLFGTEEAPRSVDSMPALAWVAKAWGVLFLALSIILIVQLGRSLGWRPWRALALGALLAAHAWSARWAISGMETPLAVFLTLLCLVALARVLLEGKGTFGPGFLLGLATLARPECWLLLALGLVAIWLAGERRRLARVAPALAGAALAVIPWSLTAWHWFHQLLPNTSAAKAGAIANATVALSTIRDSFRILLSTDALSVALALLALALAGPNLLRALPRGRREFWCVMVAWPAAVILGLAVGGVQVVSRYLLPAVPSILLLGMASFGWATDRLGSKTKGAALLAFIALYVGQNTWITVHYSAPHAHRHTAGLRTSLGSLALWARANTQPGTTFAVPDIGMFGYYSDRPVLDLFGLVTPSMAPIVVREGYDSVVQRMLFEHVGRPGYLIDRARESSRLDRTRDPENPYQFLMARTIPDLGITRPGEFVYSLYAIRWGLYDQMHPRYAGRND